MKCDQKGRLLAHVFDFATGALNAALEEANSWISLGLGADITMLRQCQVSMRAVWLLGQEQLRPFDRLPLLLAKLHMPGVRDKCLAQWAEAPAADRDSASAEFFYLTRLHFGETSRPWSPMAQA